MPEREKAVHRLTQNVIGEHYWNTFTDEALDMPTDDYVDVGKAMDDLFLRMVDSVNWSRILLEGLGRCLALKHDHDDYNTCGESVREALCSKDWAGTRSNDWSKREKVEPENMDWCSVVAKNLHHRTKRMWAGWTDGRGVY